MARRAASVIALPLLAVALALAAGLGASGAPAGARAERPPIDAGSAAGVAHLRTLEGAPLPSLDRPAFSADGSPLAAARYRSALFGGIVVSLWSVADGAYRRTLVGPYGGALAFAPRGRALAIGGDATDGAPGSGPGLIRVGDPERDAPDAVLEDPAAHGRSVTALAFSAAGDRLASLSEDALVVWDTADWTPRRRIAPGPGGASFGWSTLAFSPDGRLVAAVVRDPDASAVWRAEVWSVETGESLARLEGVSGDLAFSPDGATLLGDGPDGTSLVAWDTGSWRERWRRRDVLLRPDFAPDGGVVAAIRFNVDAEDELVLLDAADGALLHALPAPDGRALAFSPDGALLAVTGSGRGVRLYGIPGAP